MNALSAPGGGLSIVVAPDSFKGTLGADEAAAAIAEGWRSARPDDAIRMLPQADGGEGTLDAIAAAVPGSRLRTAGSVTGPDDRPTRGRWVELPGRVVVVELAAVSGLPLMSSLDPLRAHTRGLGEVIVHALESGATRVVIALGGSASTDGGAGALTALGLRLRDDRGAELLFGGAALARLAVVDDSGLRPRPADGVVLLTDVDAPLLGAAGAAAVFGPQKGATADQIGQLDAALANFAAQLGGDPGRAGSGAAGGAAYGFATAWNGIIEPGADYIAKLTGLDAAITEADVVITGEGRFDATSLTGKVVGRTLGVADRLGVDTVVIAGQISTMTLGALGARVATYALEEIAGGAEPAMADPLPVLRTAARLAAEGVAADRLAADRLAADRLAADRLAAESQ